MNYENKLVTVLGTTYTIQFKQEKDLSKSHRSQAGCVDFTTKIISITVPEKDDHTVDNIEKSIKGTMRHEIVHAFFFESGLDSNFENPVIGVSETIVDWIAIQFPKMQQAFAEADCLD